ncbi:Putative STK1 protein [Rhizopus microsporus]|nr:Putative STK1 protein [Rhizopus microsporus]
MAEFVKLSIFGTVFEVTTRYVDLQPVGMGAFGLFCQGPVDWDECGYQENHEAILRSSASKENLS